MFIFAGTWRKLMLAAASMVRARVAFDIVSGDGRPDSQRASAVVRAAAERGLIVLACGAYANVIRVLVPLTATNGVVNEEFAILRGAIEETRCQVLPRSISETARA